MDTKQTLKQRFQSMNTGETIVTKANKRAAIFVTAKRAGITVTTKEIDGDFHVTKTGDIVETVTPKLPPKKSLLDQIKELSAAERLRLFESFELCCGMNRGACICEPETVEIAKPLPTITDNRKDVLTALQAKIDGIQSGSIAPKVETVEDHWIEMPTTRENGDILYWHKKPKGNPINYKRERDWDAFA